MLDTVAGTTGMLPADKPRYFMGIGDPDGLLGVIERGVDMFDCVLPTRLGRTGSALVPGGKLNLRNARFARDGSPLVEPGDRGGPLRTLPGRAGGGGGRGHQLN